jgi:hypothetical protein
MRRAPFVFLATALFARAEGIGAQGDINAGRAIAESSAVRRNAERAARSFEQQRLRLIPNVPSSPSDVGDVIIGRYRYSAGEADDLTPPPAEPPAIGEARRELLRTLDSASRRMPGDEWIRSRFVWYSIEAGDTTAAIAAARACRDEEIPWWCDALLGLTMHVAHDFVGAEQAFDRALAAMPDSTRCRWIDVTSLVDGDVERLLKRMPCERRGALNERLWWLADPLHAVEGNELRSEHFARHTFGVLHDRWRASHPLGWGNDMREIVLRYAWPVAWSRDRFRERSPSQPGLWMALTGHEPRPAYDFLPDADALNSPVDVTDESWDLKRPRASTHYAHPYAAPMRPLRHQMARFIRGGGDSLLIVGAWDASDDTLFMRGSKRVALIASTNDGRVRFAQGSDSATTRGALTLLVPQADYLSSLELFAKAYHAAARTRRGIRSLRLTSGVALSDILLLEPGAHPRTFEEALPRILTDGALGRDRRLTLYWEVYRVDGIEVPRVTISVSRVRASRVRRLAEKLRLRDEPQTVEMEWETDTPAAQRSSGSVTLDLSDRPAGTWRVSVAVTGAHGEGATAFRDIVIRSP